MAKAHPKGEQPMKTFCVVGHDARQRAAAQTLQAAGFRIIGPEAACQADFVLLPMSQERVSDAVARTLQGVRPGTLLLAGRPGSPIQAAAGRPVCRCWTTSSGPSWNV